MNQPKPWIGDVPMNPKSLQQFKQLQRMLTRFLMMYQFALQEVETKIDILKEEFLYLHDYNPIEHTKSRLKSPESIMSKWTRKGAGRSLLDVRETITDIAGIRITCSFISDIYRLSQMLQSQSDLQFVSIKDYIKHPKANGYKSLHLLVKVPVFMSDRRESVHVEIQIRTVAMDFWASLEHKIFYKYEGTVPQHLLAELSGAAKLADDLDRKMERLHAEIHSTRGGDSAADDSSVLEELGSLPFPQALFSLMGDKTSSNED